MSENSPAEDVGAAEARSGARRPVKGGSLHPDSDGQRHQRFLKSPCAYL